MRVFGIQGNQFREYVQTPFQAEHEEKLLEQWLEANPDGIVEDGKLLIIGRQVTTNLGGFIDLLAVDRQGDVVVLELKRDRTPRDTLAQALEYASYVERLDTEQLGEVLRSYMSDESLNLAEYHREYFQLGSEEAVAFNKMQRIVIVGQCISPEIKQTASYLGSKGLNVTCIEFTFLQSQDGTKLLSQDIVIGQEAVRQATPKTASLARVTREIFMDSLDPNGRCVFSRLLEFADQRSMVFHWGVKGFSMNVVLDDTHVAVCYGYPPSYKQVIDTAWRGAGGMYHKTAVPAEVIEDIWRRAKQTGLFVPTGYDLRCQIDREFSEKETATVVSVMQEIADAVTKYGLKQ